MTKKLKINMALKLEVICTSLKIDNKLKPSKVVLVLYFLTI